jgi:hypothetical protein
MAISNCFYSPTLRQAQDRLTKILPSTGSGTNGFSIRFVFAKLVAETRNEIIHKHVGIN